MNGEKKAEPIPQAGVVPYRIADGKIEILLITASEDRWIVPKGNLEAFKTIRDSACQEAFEEAGIIGEIGPRSLGLWPYSRHGLRFSVELFPFQVTDVLADWPEQNRRKRKWLPFDKALERVSEPTLRQVLKMLPDFVQPTL